MLYSSGWAFSQDRVCRCGTMFLWYAHVIHLSAYGIACVAWDYVNTVWCLSGLQCTWRAFCIQSFSWSDSASASLLAAVMIALTNVGSITSFIAMSVSYMTWKRWNVFHQFLYKASRAAPNKRLFGFYNSRTCYKRQLWLALQVPMRTSRVAASTGAKGCIDCTCNVYMLCWMLCEVWKVVLHWRVSCLLCIPCPRQRGQQFEVPWFHDLIREKIHRQKEEAPL